MQSIVDTIMPMWERAALGCPFEQSSTSRSVLTSVTEVTGVAWQIVREGHGFSRAAITRRRSRL
ncbi:MAG: hypothetical protein WBW38_05245 [Candidatus Sulfotelmatobacter sp.]